MKFLAIGIISAMFASSTTAASMGNLRNLAVQNCRFHDANDNCTQCVFRFVLENGACKAVSDQCKTWNVSTGACLSCYDGWTLANGVCSVGGGQDPTQQPPTEQPPTEEPPTEEPPTEEPSGATCYYRQVKINGACVNVSDQCNTWNETTGACTSCYGGWTLSNGACVVGGGEDPTEQPPTEEPPTEEPPTEEPPTEEPPTEEPSGVTCYFRQVKINGACVNVSDQCKTWNETTGACTSCYGGYTLSNGACNA